MAAYALQDQGRDTVEANLDLGWEADRREYGAAAAILAGLGAHRITLLTNNPAKVAGLRAHGIDVAEIRGLEVGRTPHNAAYLHTKAVSMGHVLHLEPGIHQGASIHLDPVQAAPAAPDVDTADHILDSQETTA